MERWVGKVAIVTGASSGIGASIAEKLVEAGVVVVGLARRVERIQEAAKKLQDKPGKLYAFKADMNKEEDILQAFKWTNDSVGPVHILVNNAGICRQTDLMNGDTAKWREVFDVNVIGLCIATREAVQNMLAHKVDGHIVHINSTAGHGVQSKNNVYSASKFAVTNLTEVLRNELREAKSKIKITSVSPGVTDTEILQMTPPEFADVLATLPKLNSEDIANGVLYTLGTPPHVQVHEIIIKPLLEPIIA